MGDRGVDPHLLKAWLSARSVARGLPLPIPEHGGFRVDTNSDSETVRWVFPGIGPGLLGLARSIDKPRHFLKLCGKGCELKTNLPENWTLHSPGYFMQLFGPVDEHRLVEGYTVRLAYNAMVSEARIYHEDGTLAANGYAAETPDAFIYDRIVTHPEHRRKGLARTLMMTLRSTRQRLDNPQLLVATEMGRRLYRSLGWETISPYATASIVAD
jgi:GNAT superfamily N-acetyltransferase